MEPKYCHHIHPSGSYCQSPPLRDRDYCYFHLDDIGRRMQMAKARARAEHWELNLPMPEDLPGVQAALGQLISAFAAKRIDLRSARLLFIMLRHAAANLKSKVGWERAPFKVDASVESRVLEDPNFEAKYGLPADLDLNLPPDTAFPPPPDSEGAPQLPGAPPLSVATADDRVGELQQGASEALAKTPDTSDDSPHTRLRRRALELISQGSIMQTTPLDIELMEIAKNQGHAAMEKRIRQHEAEEGRRKSRAARHDFANEAQARTVADLVVHLLRDPIAKPVAQQLIAPQEAGSDPPAHATSPVTRKPPQSELDAPGEACAQPGEVLV